MALTIALIIFVVLALFVLYMLGRAHSTITAIKKTDEEVEALKDEAKRLNKIYTTLYVDKPFSGMYRDKKR